MRHSPGDENGEPDVDPQILVAWSMEPRRCVVWLCDEEDESRYRESIPRTGLYSLH